MSELSGWGVEIKNIEDVFKLDPNLSMVKVLAGLSVLAFACWLYKFCKNKTDKDAETQQKRNELRYRHPSEQRITNTTVGSDAVLQQRVPSRDSAPARQEIEGVNLRPRARLNQF